MDLSNPKEGVTFGGLEFEEGTSRGEAVAWHTEGGEQNLSMEWGTKL